jgi:hypothetical protein
MRRVKWLSRAATIRLLLATAIAAGLLIATTSTASAEIGYANLCPALKTPLCEATSESEFGNAPSVAVDNSSGSTAGDVWVALTQLDVTAYDSAGNKVVEIGPEGLPESAEPIFAGGHYLHQMAVDPKDGALYVAAGKEDGGSVTKFGADGVFQFQLNGSTTPQGKWHPTYVTVASSGDLYVEDEPSIGHQLIDRFGRTGEYLEQFPVQSEGRLSVASLAADAENHIYLGIVRPLGTGEVSEVRELGLTGAPVDCPSGTNTLIVGEPEHTSADGRVAVDPTNGHLFVTSFDVADNVFVDEYGSLCDAAPSRKLGEKALSQAFSWFGVSGTTHDVYIDSLDTMMIFAQVTVPDVATGESVTGITRSSATVSGTVNPDGTEVATCEFEYGTTVEYGRSVPCSQALPLMGASPVGVSAEIQGLVLPPASLVHYRLRVANANGTNFGADHSFYTEALPSPIVGGLPATGISQFAATLNGTLQTGEALVNYRFEYGTTTAYGAVAPIPDSYTPITNETLTVSQPVEGLQAGTTYHYRLLASSPGGTAVASPDETFTTVAIPAPAVGTGAASAVGVGSVTLSGTIDPHGWDTTYLFQYGTSGTYGASWPTVQVEMGALEGAQPVLVNVPNLLPNTTYHYRLVASNGGGASYGQDMTFTTGEYPAQVIQEPPALGTLLVPSEVGKVTTSVSKKKKKAKKRKLRHAAKRGRASDGSGRKKR